MPSSTEKNGRPIGGLFLEEPRGRGRGLPFMGVAGIPVNARKKEAGTGAPPERVPLLWKRDRSLAGTEVLSMSRFFGTALFLDSVPVGARTDAEKLVYGPGGLGNSGLLWEERKPGQASREPKKVKKPSSPWRVRQGKIGDRRVSFFCFASRYPTAFPGCKDRTSSILLFPKEFWTIGLRPREKRPKPCGSIRGSWFVCPRALDISRHL